MIYPNKNITEWRWRDFTPEQVLSPDGLEIFKRRNVFKLQAFAMDFLQEYRLSLDLPLLCNHAGHRRRGWRSTRENGLVEGVPDSPHMQGIAFDLNCRDLNLQDFFIRSIKFGWSCVIVYPKRGFLHHDQRTIVGEYGLAQNGENHKTVIITEELRVKPSAELFEILKKELSLPTEWRL